MNVALVYDRVNKWGGAERVLLALHELWPDAPLFTAVYDKKGASWANAFDVKPSFLQHIPFARTHHEWFAWLTPMAFESFSFDAFDVVISVTSAEAKNIITKPGTLHICYCLTPTRYLWSSFNEYARASKSLRFAAPTLRRWDCIAGQRPDYYLAISKRVANRIQTYYQRGSVRVISPPVETKKFIVNSSRFMENTKEGYFLVVSRLVPYKRIDILIEAFNHLGWPLVIIGDGTERRTLQLAAQSNIRFLHTHLTDEQLVGYYQRCRAFVFAGDEDFGIAAVEAQACGKPVIAYGSSGVAETVIDGKTGILFYEQTPQALMNALRQFTSWSYDSSDIRSHAVSFDTDSFQKIMKETVNVLYKEYL